MLRWLKTVVVSVEEKAQIMRQVGTGKANVSEPLTTCRNQEDDIKTGIAQYSRDEPGGCPSIGQAVSGMKAARARSAASAWNVGRPVPTLSTPCLRGGGERESPSGRNREVVSTVAALAGGPARSSGEAPVMGVERRGWVIDGCLI